jgi:hypothetical protein
MDASDAGGKVSLRSASIFSENTVGKASGSSPVPVPERYDEKYENAERNRRQGLCEQIVGCVQPGFESSGVLDRRFVVKSRFMCVGTVHSDAGAKC